MSESPVLLLHGALGARDQFEAIAQALAPHVTVHTLDFEGHGRAAYAGRVFRTATFAANVLDYLDAHGLDTVDIVGYSMGGYVGLYLARFHPQRVRRLFTLGTKLAWSPAFAAGEVRMLDADRISAKVPAFAETLALRHSAYGWCNVLAATAEMMLALGQAPDICFDDLKSIACPVRIAVGDRDHMVTLDECSEALRMLPQGELQVLPATPHPLEKVSSGRLVAAVMDFLGVAPG